MAYGTLQSIVGFLSTDGTGLNKDLDGGMVEASIKLVEREHGPVCIEPRPDVLEFSPHALDTVPPGMLRAYVAKREVPVKVGSSLVDDFGGIRHQVHMRTIPPEGAYFSAERAFVLLHRWPQLLREQDPTDKAFPDGYDPSAPAPVVEAVEAVPVEDKPAPKPKKKPRKTAASKAATGETPKKPRRNVAKAADAADKE